MLVLSRYRDESIYIGDDVVITVVDIRGDRVRIGVQAPSDVSVHRQEVYEAIKNGNGTKNGSQRESVPPVPKPMSASTVSATTSTVAPGVSPLGQELSKRKAKVAEAKGLPVSITTVEFGGLTPDGAVLPR